MTNGTDLVLCMCSMLFPAWSRCKYWSYGESDTDMKLTLDQTDSGLSYSPSPSDRYGVGLFHIPRRELSTSRIEELTGLSFLCSASGTPSTLFSGIGEYVDRITAKEEDRTDRSAIKQASLSEVRSWRVQQYEYSGVRSMQGIFSLEEVAKVRRIMESLPCDVMVVVYVTRSIRSQTPLMGFNALVDADQVVDGVVKSALTCEEAESGYTRLVEQLVEMATVSGGDLRAYIQDMKDAITAAATASTSSGIPIKYMVLDDIRGTDYVHAYKHLNRMVKAGISAIRDNEWCTVGVDNQIDNKMVDWLLRPSFAANDFIRELWESTAEVDYNEYYKDS